MNLLGLVVLFPLAGSVILSFSPRMPDRAAATIGAGASGLSALTAAWVIAAFVTAGGHPFDQTLWNWVAVGAFHPDIAFYLDGLSATMMGIITGVGFLILLFSTWYMREELEGKYGTARFFAYMNLFLASMLVLVLGDNLLLLFLGWECVGLCSYLLIGFHYHDKSNAWAAYKAFIMSRIGDVSLAIGLYLLFATFHTLHIQTLNDLMPQSWSQGDIMAMAAALLLLGGAVGKSAQLPLQTWLPDAMAGPTPVSALIHAATMVTAGVYLIARMHVLYLLAPLAMDLVAIVGAVTLLLAGFAALAQTDIKRVLAYSTMSQIGYMFLALGVGAWDAAIFHLMVHAFFKALLFLTAGSVIIACHHEQDMFRMGGLRHKLKLDYAVFLIAGCSLSALPLFTAGFFSKDEIISKTFTSGHEILWIAALVGSFLTAVYTFRMIFLTFHGEEKTSPHPGKGIPHTFPLIVLGFLSTFLGALIPLPLSGALPGGHEGQGNPTLILEIISSVIAVVGLGVATALYLGNRGFIERMVATLPGRLLWRFWNRAWGFDWLYDRVLVQPWRFVGRLHELDWIDWLANRVPVTALVLNGSLTAAENGRLRWYAVTFIAGAVILFAALLFA